MRIDAVLNSLEQQSTRQIHQHNCLATKMHLDHYNYIINIKVLACSNGVLLAACICTYKMGCFSSVKRSTESTERAVLCPSRWHPWGKISRRRLKWSKTRAKQFPADKFSARDVDDFVQVWTCHLKLPALKLLDMYLRPFAHRHFHRY